MVDHTEALVESTFTLTFVVEPDFPKEMWEALIEHATARLMKWGEPHYSNGIAPTPDQSLPALVVEPRDLGKAGDVYLSPPFGFRLTHAEACLSHIVVPASKHARDWNQDGLWRTAPRDVPLHFPTANSIVVRFNGMLKKVELAQPMKNPNSIEASWAFFRDTVHHISHMAETATAAKKLLQAQANGDPGFVSRMISELFEVIGNEL